MTLLDFVCQEMHFVIPLSMENKIGSKDIKNVQQCDKKDYRCGYSNRLVDENGKTLIVVHLDGDPAMAYKNYSNRYNLKISPDLYDHICAENSNCKRPVHIKVYNDVLLQNNTRRDLLKLSMQNTFTTKRLELLGELRSCILFGILYWAICIAIVIGAFLLYEALPVAGLLELLVIVAWVFGWAGTDKLLMDHIRLRKEYRGVLNLALAEISFVPLPPPIVPTKN